VARPPPGVELEESAEDKAKRKKRSMKAVGFVVAAAVGLLVIGLAFRSGKSTDSGDGEPASSGTEPEPAAKTEPAKAAEPEPTQQTESPPPEETAKTAEPEPEKTAEPEKPVVRSTTRWRPRTTTTTKSTTTTTKSTTPNPRSQSSFTVRDLIFLHLEPLHARV
jgi:hypothetical protein